MSLNTTNSRGFDPVGRTRNTVSAVGAAPKLYAPAVVTCASVTHPSSFSDHASIRAGLKGEE